MALAVPHHSTTRGDGGRRLLFDQVETTAGRSLEEVLRATWDDAIDAGSVENRIVNGRPGGARW